MQLPARALFYAQMDTAQYAAALLSDPVTRKNFKAKVKPQLTPVFTTYPPSLGARAAFGLTACLELKARSSDTALAQRVVQAGIDASTLAHLDTNAYAHMNNIVADTVQSRLILEEMWKEEALFAVENYRLFSASQQTMNFPSVPSILRYVVLFGDVLPDWEERGLHQMTRSLLTGVEDASRPYFSKLSRCSPRDYMQLGEDWVRDIMAALSDFLPEEANSEAEERPPGLPGEGVGRYDERPPEAPERLHPPGGKHPPALFDPPVSTPGPGGGSRKPRPRSRRKELLEQLVTGSEAEFLHALKQGRAGDLDQEQNPTFARFVQALDRASGQDRHWEDLRSDLAEEASCVGVFTEGPVSGEHSQGHEVKLSVAGEFYAGALHDRAIEFNAAAPEDLNLVAEAETVFAKLRRLIFVNREPVTACERFTSTGSLDPARLPLASCSEAVFRRHWPREVAARRGRPVLCLLNDHSGSVGREQTRLMKVLSIAWIKACLRLRVHLLAGMYHQERVRNGQNGPLVEWLYHPERTLALSPQDALHSIAAIPDKGSGGQADALSMQFVLDEAVRLAKNRNIYMIILCDCKWCPSFPEFSQRSKRDPVGAELEVRAFFAGAKERLGSRLHITLVGLDALKPESYADVVDKVIVVTAAELSNYTAVAEKVGSYVAACMREHSDLLGGR